MSRARRASQVGALALFAGFLGLAMLRASAGCTKSEAPLHPDAPPQRGAEPPAATLAPSPHSAPTPAPPPSAAPSAKPVEKPAGPPSGYFPGTKAAPMRWEPPQQQQAAPRK